jgi:hypothetical protein
MAIPPSSPKTTFMSLPPELHLLLSRSLPYPDLLALKHTHPYFYSLIRTTVYDRVDWLLERPQHGLPLPQTKCIMKTDEQFCSHAEIRNFMERRRKHQDCIGVCFVVEGTKCEGAVMRGLRAPWNRSHSGKRRTYWISGTSLACFVLLLALFLTRWY